MYNNVLNNYESTFNMIRKETGIEDINEFNEITKLKRIEIIASDGASNYIRTPLNKLSENGFKKFIEYHLSTCNRGDLLGASSHLLDIVKK